MSIKEIGGYVVLAHLRYLTSSVRSRELIEVTQVVSQRNSTPNASSRPKENLNHAKTVLLDL
jgi:hypothetical protein